MPVYCQKSSSGGKGNQGKFIERDPKICAAGLPSSQPEENVSDNLKYYLLQDEVKALVSDAIISPPKLTPLPALRRPPPLDKRNAGPFGDVAAIIHPPMKTKFQTLVEEFKDTVYSSYWKKPLGKVSDPVPMLPPGLDVSNITFGKRTPFHDRLYDVIMPKEPFPDKTPYSKQPGVQTNRKYCTPPFDTNVTYGYRTNCDKRGKWVKCCLTDDRTLLGTAGRNITNSIQSNFQDATQPRLGEVLAPNDNIKKVPNDYAFGKLKSPDNLPECLTTCEINPNKERIRACLAHLNSLRKCMSKRYLPTFFRELYSNLKYFDTDKTGWLPKGTIYNFCGTKFIRFDPKLIEPLLSIWQVFDGSNIQYKTFVQIINYREPSPGLPKILDIPPDCIDFRTTYTEMMKPNQGQDQNKMAGIPSGRYFDQDYPVTPEGYCKADRFYLPQESDMKSCISPSVLTLCNVTHRDMYAKRDPSVLKKVFEGSGEKFTEERFNAVWNEAKEYHSDGWVCYETFRRALKNHPDPNVLKTVQYSDPQTNKITFNSK